jgi:hypothetical protein
MDIVPKLAESTSRWAEDGRRLAEKNKGLGPKYGYNPM